MNTIHIIDSEWRMNNAGYSVYQVGNSKSWTFRLEFRDVLP